MNENRETNKLMIFLLLLLKCSKTYFGTVLIKFGFFFHFLQNLLDPENNNIHLK